MTVTSDSSGRLRGTYFFLAAMSVALIWAAYTDHVWEDYFITYRTSKNLAEGNGLVFQVGERLHTFTSPLGVLLPALCHVMTGRGSDIATLWVFRVMGALAFAGTLLLVWKMTRRTAGEPLGPYAGIAVAVAVMVDPKIVDFSMNGQETAFLLLGFAWALWTLAAKPRREALHLGGAWALLMWSRPDAFIYIAAMGLATLLFRPRRSGESRWSTLRTFIGAGLVTTVLYSPWLLWTEWYYGTPVPHPALVKSVLGGKRDLLELAVNFPGKLWRNPAMLAATFLPPYGPYVGWPRWAFWLAVPFGFAALILPSVSTWLRQPSTPSLVWRAEG
jgi:hypothetical protein